MTRDLWDRLWWLHFKAARKRQPEVPLPELQERVRWAMEQTYGPQPEESESKPGELPWWARLGLKLVPGKEKLNMQVNTIFRAVVYGLVAGLAALQTGITDDVVSMQEWVGVAVAFATAFWAKLSNPNKAISTKPDDA